ncbi:hypothetical protein C6568_16355 [Melaminivora suipulveris]|uniref:Translesion DNA synthesis-associated protein ImuA n=1 Tax=Melaminivora suipulveris TaxID=2109913 RepID=A0A2R3QFS1_9BURK|nr:translesion DNA synthesis-associated protein ImuA [Melaminivora suipulveris]AVO50631.1 hypothetical protein C6568_16355 [Melaminivora suipulveris]
MTATAPAQPASALNLPGLWRGQDWLGAPQPAVSSGHAALDAELPGSGWPLGALCEVLLAPQARSEWALVLPALAARLQGTGGQAVLVAPPLEPFAPALQAASVPAQRLCSVSPGFGPADGAAAAWACEQALRCRDVRAVLAWLPLASTAVLRRLQLAAAQQRQLLWVFRPAQSHPAASPAPLRLQLESARRALLVHVLKRRGPPLEQPVALPVCSPALAQVLTAQAARRRQMQQQAGAQRRPSPDTQSAAPGAPLVPHALAGVAAAAD